jgi:hypothetical protein
MAFIRNRTIISGRFILGLGRGGRGKAAFPTIWASRALGLYSEVLKQPLPIGSPLPLVLQGLLVLPEGGV